MIPCLNKIITINTYIDLKTQGIFDSTKIVFTNGCFDIVHSGHVLYLEEAKKMGDILVLGLNSDNSVKRLKGEERPINQENDRAIVLAGLYSIDYIIIFEEDTPFELIKKVQPDVLVKGGDWAIEEIVGYDVVTGYGGQVKSLMYKAGKSTTNIVDKIKSEYDARRNI